jgi:hypothetical protein
MPHIRRSFAVLRRHFTQRELIEFEWRLRLSQDDTNDGADEMELLSPLAASSFSATS